MGFKLKVSFNPGLKKQAQEVTFSRKLNKPFHQKVSFNSVLFVCDDWQKHLGIYLDKALNFNFHIKEKMSKPMQEMVSSKTQQNSSHHSLITIYKSFVKPHVDFDDIIYDQPNNETSTQKIERIQYNDTLAIIGTIKEKSQSKLYSELDFESLKLSRWFRKLCTFLKLKTSSLPQCLFDLIPQKNHFYNIRYLEDATTFYSRTDASK